MENTTNQQNSGQGFAIAGLVTGIIALLIAIIPCVGIIAIVLGIVAVIFGAIAFSKATSDNSPKGMSIAGLTLGAVSIFLAIFWLTFVIGSTNQFKNKAEHFFEFFEEFDNSNIDFDEEFDEEFEDLDSLDDLEKTLDELEIETYEVDDSVSAKIE